MQPSSQPQPSASPAASGAAPSASDATPEPPRNATATGSQRASVPPGAWMVLVAVGVGTFMSALDSSIVNVALPLMRVSLGASVALVEWVVTVYLLVVSGTLLGFGRLGDLRGHKPVYMAGFSLFVLGSLLAAFSKAIPMLVGARAVQAIGAAMLFSNSPAILTMAFPPQRRGQVLGLQATLTYLGLTLGPPLGGLLTRVFGWPSIFLVNLPIGAVALFLTWRFVPSDPGNAETEPFDFAGAALFFLGLVGLMLALNQGHAWGWTSPRTATLLGISGALLAVFLLWESRARGPMLDLSLFSSRVFSATTISALLNYVAIYTVVFIMPFYLIQGRGLPPEQAGLLLAVQSIVMAIASPLAGALSDRTGPRLLTVSGMMLLAGALLGLSTIGARVSLAVVAAFLAMAGLGTGLFVSPNNSALMGSAPRHRLGIASGVLAEARNVGMVLGVGLAGAVFTTLLAGQDPGPHPIFFAAVRASFLAASVVAGLAAATSALV